jgi:hypothetical protein
MVAESHPKPAKSERCLFACRCCRPYKPCSAFIGLYFPGRYCSAAILMVVPEYPAIGYCRVACPGALALEV